MDADTAYSEGFSNYLGQMGYELRGDLCTMPVKQGYSELPSDQLEGDIRAVQQNLRAQGSTVHLHICKLFSSHLILFFLQKPELSTYSNEKGPSSHHTPFMITLL